MTDLFKDRAKDFDSNDDPRQLSTNIGATLLRRVKLEKENPGHPLASPCQRATKYFGAGCA